MPNRIIFSGSASLALILFACGCEPSGPTPSTAPAFSPSASGGDAPADEPAEPPTGGGNSGADVASAATPLIPRAVLFGNPEKAAARLSPDGKLLSFLAPVEGVLNVWVGPRDDLSQAKPVTNDTERGIRTYFWAYTNEHILYTQDVGGNENFHVYSANLSTGETKDLTPIDGVAARIADVSEKFPTEILVALNDKNPQFHDIHKVNIESGELTLVEQNTDFADFITDDDYRVRFAMRYTPDGGNAILQKDEAGEWQPYAEIPMEDSMTTSPVGFNKSGDVLYLIDSRGRDTGALTTVDLATKDQQVLAEDPRADMEGAIVHPTEKTVQAVSFVYQRKEWKILDDAIAADFDYLKTVADGEMEITSRTLADDYWTVAYVLDDGPVTAYLYDRSAKKAKFLFSTREELSNQPLVKMHSAAIKSRDGLDLVSYYSLPKDSDSDGDGMPEKPLPMVLVVHGGPWGRDTWGFDPEHQLLANRGYAVMGVNFRGSTGFGKSFINAGNREWGAKMHDDLLDAVAWAIQEKIADPDRVAIMGGSYGGYATLVGLTMTPDVFACGVDIVGPSNIVTLLNTIPPYWAPAIKQFTTRVGDHQTEEGRKFLEERSPLSYVDKIKRPLLIGQGANDPRVKQSEADQIVQAMQAKKIPVAYVLYPDEGHGFARPENRLSFYAVTEAFLAEHLGGRYEPVGVAFEGSSITVPVGADQVPGLAEAIEAPASKTGS